MFIGSCAGTFYALDRRTGDPRWTYDIRQDGKQLSFHGGMLVDHQTVMFDTDMSCAPEGIGHVYAAEHRTGRMLWKSRFPAGISSNLLRTRSSVCFGTTRGEWGCLDAKDGKVRWMVAPGGTSECALPVWADTDSHRLFVIARDGSVVALRASDGKMLWQRRLGAQASTSPVVVQGLVTVGAGDGRVYSLTAASGRVVHSVSVGGRPVGRPAVSSRGLFFFTENVNGSSGRVVALDPGAKRVRWYREHDREFASEQPHVWRDVVIAADCRGAVHAFAVADGAPRWETRVDGCIRSVASSNDLLFLGAESGMVYAIQP